MVPASHSRSPANDVSTAFNPDTEFFTPLSPPLPGDWYAEHWNDGQTFEQFVTAYPAPLAKGRRVIYLQPVEGFASDQSPQFDLLQAYVKTYFALQVQILPALLQDEETFSSRFNPHTNTQQFLTTDILRALQHSFPVDACCVLAITMQDLYPNPEWNFVFGQSSVEDHVSVFSIVRYDPAFYNIPRDEGYGSVLLRRCCQLLIYEIAHLFGLSNCIFYACSLNGSHHLQESDSRPMHVCPICLRKLHYCIDFDIMARYRNLYHFYQRVGFQEEAHWVQKRFAKLVQKRMAFLEQAA
jgi:archaemetzincin